MRRLVLSLSLSAAALLGAADSTRANFSATDGDLREELDFRTEFLASSTDKAEVKQYKAVLKALKFMDKTADDLGDDIKTAGKVRKTLAKAFPDEFSTAGFDVSLGDSCRSLFIALQSLVEADLDDLSGDVSALSPKGQTKVNAALAAAGLALDAVDQQFQDEWAKLLAKAYKSWVKGRKTADKDPGPPVGLSITVDGKAFKPNGDTVAIAFNEVAGLLVFTASKTGLPAYNLSVTPGAVFSTGSVGVSVASWNVIALPPKNYLITDGGTFEVTALDNEANTISFNFSFTAPGVNGTTGSVTISGSYSGPFTSGSDL